MSFPVFLPRVVPQVTLKSITRVAAEVGAWRGLLMYVDSHICKWVFEWSEGHKQKKNPVDQ